MALTPFGRMFSWDPWNDAPMRLYNQAFGSDLQELNQVMRQGDTGLSELDVNNDHFKVRLDCRHFKPEEMNVKIQDNRITLHAKHEEKQDPHGYVKREFTRSYLLPQGCDASKIKSQLTQDGMLSIECPRQVEEAKGTRSIPIERATSQRSIQH